jgi:hypothetical protein
MFNITCQSAMDCRGGEVCCFSFMTGGGGFGGGGGSQCQAGACPMGGFQLCAGSNSGCPMGETCTAAPGGMGHYCAAGSGAPDGSTAAGDDASTAADAAAVCTASCTGCCDWGSPTARRNGACVAGTQDTLCGNMGGACQDCTSFGAFCGSGVCNRPGTATDAASE